MKKIIKTLFRQKHSQKASKLGYLDSYDGNHIRGWAVDTTSDGDAKIALYIQQEFYTTVNANEYREDLSGIDFRNGCVSFKKPLLLQQLFIQYGANISIDARFHSDNTPLIGSPLEINTPVVEWKIDSFNSQTISGWILDKENPHTQLELNIWVNGEIVEKVFAAGESIELKQKNLENIYHGFTVNLAKYFGSKSECNVKVTLDYDKTYVLIENPRLLSQGTYISLLQNLQTALRSSPLLEKEEQNRLIQDVIPSVISSYRSGTIRCSEHTHISSSIDRYQRPIVVIVPVYKGVNITIDCLRSILNSKCNTKFDLLVVNDCSPEDSMSSELERLKDRYDFDLLTNQQNIGYVASINLGAERYPTHDLIILNSDTLVGDHWIDNLSDIAYSHKMIGTVTPLSNNATIFSFPEINTQNKMSSKLELADFIKAAERVSEPPIDVPTGHGFCMYIKRKLIEEIGLFDNIWGRGYGEENDFSIRAAMVGWKNVATHKTFVYHHGATSFGSESKLRQSNNLSKLQRLYPEYQEQIHRFNNKDPLRKLRCEIFSQLLHVLSIKLDGYSSTVLFVRHNFGGGTEVAENNIAARLQRENVHVVNLNVGKNGYWKIYSREFLISAEFDVVSEYTELVKHLSLLKIKFIHIHHTLQFSRRIWRLPKDLSCEYDVSIHDYYYICPRLNLSNPHGEYCGEPSNDACNFCIEKNGVYPAANVSVDSLNIVNWRTGYLKVLSEARRVIAPTEDVKKRIERYFNLENLVVLPHVEKNNLKSIVLPSSCINTLRIGVIGAISDIKGLNRVKQLVEYLNKMTEEISVTIFGYTFDDEFFKEYKFVKITGKYDRAKLENEILGEKIDVFYMSSTIPETFSFTYSEVISMGFPVVAFDIGAIAERVREHRSGKLLPLNADTEEIVKTLYDQKGKQVTVNQDFIVEYKAPLLKSYYGIDQ